MSIVLGLKFAHLLLFVYWLGGDLGTYYASRWVMRGDLGASPRLTSARIMLAIDTVPRLCMPLALATGVNLAALQGRLIVSPMAVAAVWTLAVFWLALAWSAHHCRGRTNSARLERIDRWFRQLVAVGLAMFAFTVLASGTGDSTWVAIKLLVFDVAVIAGLAVRRALAHFPRALAELASLAEAAPGAPARRDTSLALEDALRRCRGWVALIWLTLLTNAALGIHLLP